MEGAPWAPEIRTAPTGHYATPVAAADPDRKPQHRGQQDDGPGLLEQVRRDVLREVQSLAHHPALAVSPTYLRRGQDTEHHNPSRNARLSG